jgi:hypothetical protein
MIKRKTMVFTIFIFLLTALGIGVLIFLPQEIFSQNSPELSQTKVVIPQNIGSGGNPNELLENQSIKEGSATKVLFSESESVISILSRDFNGDSREEQVIAYRNLQEIDTPIFVSYVDVDKTGNYARVWTAPTAATRPSSLILYSEDLIGDGGICVLISGMNGAGEQTLTVFRMNLFESVFSEPFTKIAEFIIEGSITVEDVQKSWDYQQTVRGKSLSISTFGRDYESSNILDQIETTYSYNTINGLYEQSNMVKVPGHQVEQLMVSELLSVPGKFEEFVDGLWIRTLNNGQNQSVYFNMSKSEMIFYFNNTEEVFTLQESSATRYGLHIIGKNTSLAKLRCTVNIELESLESIRLRVFQDAYLRTGPGIVWDGSYKKVQVMETAAGEKRILPYLEGTYGNPDGKIVFYRDGSYELGTAEKILHKGKYVFFNMGKDELLELRPSVPENLPRETLKIGRTENESITLTRVRIGTRGIQELEMPVSLAKDQS